MKKVLYLILFLGLTGCVSKSKYEKLETDYQSLIMEKRTLETDLASVQQSYFQVKSDYDEMLESKRKEEIQRNSKKYISETEALGYIRDYYSFYDGDTKYRNVQLRRTDKNRFKVSLEEVTKKGSFSNNEFFWSSAVFNLIVNNDDTYKFERSF